jgi:hypothetical protein
MRIRIGYEITYDCPQATPFVLTLRVSAPRRLGRSSSNGCFATKVSRLTQRVKALGA